MYLFIFKKSVFLTIVIQLALNLNSGTVVVSLILKKKIVTWDF